jgi:succinyl-diaminopimelate desuccinylase
MNNSDVISLCSDLIKCKSVTPNDDGALDVIANYLMTIGFETNIMTFKSADGTNSIRNLFAKYGTSKNKVLGFLGHSDVVPAGDGWEVDPFGAIQKDGYLVGRGVADMKGGIAAFCSAAATFVREKSFDGTIEILVTGDEEIGSYEGAQSLIKWCDENGFMPRDCLIGEPTSRKKIGDTVYLGHRGSFGVEAKAIGKQGHVAYPENYINSLANLCRYIARLKDYEWKHSDKRFPKTNLEPTMLFTNNYAMNVVPDASSAIMNIRYGAEYSVSNLKEIVLDSADRYGIQVKFTEYGSPYYCDDEKLKALLSAAIAEITGENPEFSAAGGTSDGRYMHAHCNVIEFGPQDDSIHQKNEKIAIDDLIILEKIYLSFIRRYFQ